MERWQLVFVPLTAMGHIVSAVEFAKVLINRDEHLSTTVIIIKEPDDSNVDAYIKSVTPSPPLPQRLCFTRLPPYPDPTNSQKLHHSSFLDSLIEHQKQHVRDVVSKLTSAPDSPRLAGLVVDLFCTTMLDVATEFGVTPLVFYTSGAAFLGFMRHIHTLREQGKLDTTALNFKDSGSEFAVPSYGNRVPASVFPSVMLGKEWARSFFNCASQMKKAKGVIVNTFEELESHAVESLSHNGLNVYPVGPILKDPQLGSDHEACLVTFGNQNPLLRLPRQNSSRMFTSESVSVLPTDYPNKPVMAWLDDQHASSVLFLCFGSRCCFDEEGKQAKEIARAIEASGVHFLWSLRKPPAKGKEEVPRYYSGPELKEVLPEGFLERTDEIGRVIGWAPQAQILAHKAVGGFVSHCGWNSILESIHHGVPIATLPLTAEQHIIAFELLRELKLSVEVSLDYREEWRDGSESGVIGAERIEEAIKQVMEEESEVRKRVREMREMSRRALMEGGSSYSHLGRFIHDIRTI